MRDLIIFDCDGTLVDTIIDVARCFNMALATCGFPQHPIEEYREFVGGDLETVVSKLLPSESNSSDNINRVKCAYRHIYAEDSKPNTVPFDGMVNLLRKLKLHNILLAVNSNKAQVLTEDVINKNFPKDLFDSIDRTTLMIRESEKKPVIIDVKDTSMSLAINSGIGSMSEDIDISKEGKDILIGFNPKFLMDALKVIDEEEITMDTTLEERQMEAIQISDDFIKLGQALKLANMVSSGVEAKIVIQEGLVKVNGEVDTRRGRKLYPQDVFEFEGQEVTVLAE